MSEIEVAMEGRDDSERKKVAVGAQARRRCDNIEWGLLMTLPGPPLPPGAKEGAVMEEEEEEVARRTERRDLDSLRKNR